MKNLIRLLILGAGLSLPGLALAQYNSIGNGAIQFSPGGGHIAIEVMGTSTPTATASGSDLYGHFDIGIGSVSVSVGSIVAGSNDMRGTVVTGTGAQDVITFGLPWGATSPTCITSSTSTWVVSSSSITLAPTTALTVRYLCFGR